MARTDTSDADLQPADGHNGTTTYTGLEQAITDFLNREPDADPDAEDE